MPKEFERPNCARLAANRDKTQTIHDFLEEIFEKGVELVRTTPKYWVYVKTGKPAPDPGDDLVRMDRDDLYKLTNRDNVISAIFLPTIHYKAYKNGEPKETVAEWLLCEAAESRTPIGTSGPALDDLLYSFIGVDPKELDKERQAILDSLSTPQE